MQSDRPSFEIENQSSLRDMIVFSDGFHSSAREVKALYVWEMAVP